MRGLGIALAFLGLLGCAQVSGLDGYCPLEGNAPLDAPCRLTAPSCGCPEDFACRLEAFTGRRSCESVRFSDNEPPGEPCNRDTDCAAGAGCFPSGGSVCHSYCEFGDECGAMGPHSRCVDIGGAGLCTVSCRPGSPDCGAGEACVSLDGGTRCAPAGSNTFLAPCSPESACAQGLQCVTSPEGTRCMAICGPDLPECTGVRQCTRIEGEGPLGPDEFGACLVPS